jgi:hypothetical protein
MTSALSVILKKEVLAWALFAFGISFIVVPEVYGWIMSAMFGSRRPDFHTIDRMGSVEYEPLLHDPRSRRWIELVDWWNGY